MQSGEISARSALLEICWRTGETLYTRSKGHAQGGTGPRADCVITCSEVAVARHF